MSSDSGSNSESTSFLAPNSSNEPVPGTSSISFSEEEEEEEEGEEM